MPRALSLVGGAGAGLLVVLVSLLAGYGWLYGLRQTGSLRVGPPVADSLPLLQLAGFDRQPLARVVVAWLLAGLIAGVALIRVRPLQRASIVGVLGLVLLLISSQAADALARNLRFSHVLISRRPGFGPLVEAVMLAVGCALPRPVFGSERAARRRSPRLGVARDSGLRPGQYRHAAEHDRDRDHVGADGHRVGA